MSKLQELIYEMFTIVPAYVLTMISLCNIGGREFWWESLIAFALFCFGIYGIYIINKKQKLIEEQLKNNK